jgi:hypothetical protein
LRGQILFSELGGDLSQPLLDEMQPPITILVKGDGVVGRGIRGCRRGLGREIEGGGKQAGGRGERISGYRVHRVSPRPKSEQTMYDIGRIPG